MTPQYLIILMTERRGAIIFCMILAPLNAPPQTPQYLTILMTERGAPFSFVGLILATPPPSLDQTILINDLNNSRERGWGANILEEVKYVTILLLIL